STASCFYHNWFNLLGFFFNQFRSCHVLKRLVLCECADSGQHITGLLRKEKIGVSHFCFVESRLNGKFLKEESNHE
ncbi:MAG: hypothetical protein PHS31_10025, partial [Victivallaceae bacterium]|nr:hypothetical protein [Victivallaceae bacterium]